MFDKSTSINLRSLVLRILRVFLSLRCVPQENMQDTDRRLLANWPLELIQTMLDFLVIKDVGLPWFSM